MKRRAALRAVSLATLAMIMLFVGTIAAVAQEAPGTSQVQAETQPESALTNQDVIKLSQTGLENSVIIAKINTAPKVDFKLDTDDLIALKQANVSQDVITAMLNRSNSPVAVQGGAGGGGVLDTPMGAMAIPGADDLLVRLVTKDGTKDLSSIAGHIGTTYAFVTVLTFMDYPNLKAETRIRDRKPYILIQSRKSPQGRFFLVRCESNSGDNNRSVKMGKSGMWSTSGFGAPDGDWTVPFEVTQIQPGLWRMDPKKDMKPGEYGVWGPSSELFDFGVDK